MRKYSKYIFLGIAVSLLNLLFAEEVQVSSSVNKNSMTENELVKYTIKVEGDRNANISRPDFENFRIERGPSRSSRVQIINGKVSTTKEIIWWLTPLKSGELVLSPVEVQVQGGTKKTKEIEIEVSRQTEKKQSEKQRTQQGKNKEEEDLPEVFLKAEPENQQIYEGEQLNVDFVLYFRRKVQNLARQKLPEGTNFWTEEFQPEQRPNVTEVKYSGKKYNRAVLQKMAFFPTATGSLTIDPMKIKAEVVKERERQGRGGFDNSFFDNSFFNETEVQSLSSDPVEIQVNSLPAPTPDNFSGGVGQYSIEADRDTNRVKKDEAFSIVYRIQGQGNINSISLLQPEISFSSEIFDPNVDRSTEKRAGKVLGQVSYEYVIIPKETGEFTIPGYKFVYFDPGREEYITKETPDFNIKVVQNIRSNQETEKEDRNEVKTDIRYIKTEANNWKRIGNEFYDYWWFWGFIVIGSLIFGVTLIYEYGQEQLNMLPTFFRQNKAYEKSTRLLEQAEKDLDDRHYEKLMNRVSSAVVKIIIARLDLSTDKEEWEQIRKDLKNAEVEEDVITRVESLFRKIEQMKYAPEDKSEEEYTNLIQKSQNILDELREKL